MDNTNSNRCDERNSCNCNSNRTYCPPNCCPTPDPVGPTGPAGAVTPAAAVTDATGPDDVVQQFNLLLANLRAAGLLN